MSLQEVNAVAVYCVQQVFNAKRALASLTKNMRFTTEQLLVKVEKLVQADQNLANAQVELEKLKPVYPECDPPPTVYSPKNVAKEHGQLGR